MQSAEYRCPSCESSNAAPPYPVTTMVCRKCGGLIPVLQTAAPIPDAQPLPSGPATAATAAAPERPDKPVPDNSALARRLAGLEKLAPVPPPPPPPPPAEPDIPDRVNLTERDSPASGYVTIGLGVLVLFLMLFFAGQFDVIFGRLLGVGVGLVLLGAYCALTRTPVWSCSRVVWIVFGLVPGLVAWGLWMAHLASVAPGRPG